MRAGDGAVDHRGAIDLVAGGVELLHEHIVGAATDAVVAVPGHHKAAVAQRGDAGVILIGLAVGRADLELPAHLRTAAVETLTMDLVIGRPPHHHIAAVGEHRHIVAVLVAGDRARHSLLGHRDRAIGVEDLAEHTVATAVVGTGIGIYSDELATRQRRQARVELGARDGGIEGEFVCQQRAIYRVTLGQHVRRVGGGGVITAVGDDEAAIAQADHRRFVLGAGSRRVDAELATRERPVGAITLGIDTGARAILAFGAPHHHETTVGERAHFGLVLVALGEGIDLELGTHGSALGVEALAIDTVAAAVLGIIGAPYHHVATGVRALQRGHNRRRLLASLVGVDLLFAKQRAGTVSLRCHVDHHLACAARHAGAVAHDDLHRTRGKRTVRAGSVGQVLDHALNRLSGRGRVEVDHKLVAIGAGVRGVDGADQHPAVADVSAGDADLCRRAALVADGELVLGTARVRHIGHRQTAASEAGGAVIAELDTGIEHRPRLGGGFGQRDRGFDILQLDRGQSDTGLDAHQHRLRRTRRPIAIKQAEAQIAISLAGTRRSVDISDVLHQRLHRLGGGAGVEVDHQVGARSGAAEAADHRAAIAHVIAGNADFARPRAQVADRERLVRMRGRRAIKELHDQLATGEVRRIGVADVHIGVDDLRASCIERRGIVVRQV